MKTIDARVKQFADAIIPIISIPEIFPDIAIEDFPKIVKELEKLLTRKETHSEDGEGFCKQFPVKIAFVCGLDILEIQYTDLLKIFNKESETEMFIEYVKSMLESNKQ